jgi:DNA-binding MarR family transcriptional regulator
MVLHGAAPGRAVRGELRSTARQAGAYPTLLTAVVQYPNISVTDVSMANPQLPHELVPLSPPVFHILLALADEERHGYGIMQDVARQTGNALQLGPGTLYGCLKRMLAAGLVEESDERPDPALDDERRRYYRMTRLGKRVARAETQRLAGAVMVAKTKLAGGNA